ncbi:PEP-CTERM sorting domain-containing protein [Rubellicoccus peritrichatus]|uniref:PEP-CTERM sorting domain-containing protein n=1 Tax=Rubellicoccus peritrichatus TaxID=3080537 RepID=A0AAQ3QVW2_9BACT|nr:PEP-CTERM sorting domain-containing protein [Puniceicoccus sp. CR14]WOO41282.1 PEP-CTERM sorting domain-containing protein [Puniceicoccus sp. CR14]
MIKPISTLLFAACCAFFANSAQGLIVLTVDATAKTFDVSGSIVGTPQSTGPLSYLDFFSPSSGNVLGSDFMNLTAFSSSTPNTIFSTIMVVRDFDVQDDAYMRFAINGSGPLPEQTVSMSAIGVDYTVMEAQYQTILENLATAGTTMTVTFGTSSDTIQVTAVPEPGTYAALTGLATLGYIVWYRRRT